MLFMGRFFYAAGLCNSGVALHNYINFYSLIFHFCALPYICSPEMIVSFSKYQISYGKDI